MDKGGAKPERGYPRAHAGYLQLGLAMFNTYTKSEVSTTTCSDDVKGNAKCKNSRFERPSGGLRGNVHGSSMAS